MFGGSVPTNNVVSIFPFCLFNCLFDFVSFLSYHRSIHIFYRDGRRSSYKSTIVCPGNIRSLPTLVRAEAPCPATNSTA